MREYKKFLRFWRLKMKKTILLIPILVLALTLSVTALASELGADGVAETLPLPTVADLYFELPVTFVYDGAEHTAAVTKENDAIGEITIMYQLGDAEAVPDAPVEIGEYTVIAAIAESEQYAAARLELGTLTITPAMPSEDAEPENAPQAEESEPVPPTEAPESVLPTEEPEPLTPPVNPESVLPTEEPESSTPPEEPESADTEAEIIAEVTEIAADSGGVDMLDLLTLARIAVGLDPLTPEVRTAFGIDNAVTTITVLDVIKYLKLVVA
jgi:hypothetical protein